MVRKWKWSSLTLWSSVCWQNTDATDTALSALWKVRLKSSGESEHAAGSFSDLLPLSSKKSPTAGRRSSVPRLQRPVLVLCQVDNPHYGDACPHA